MPRDSRVAPSHSSARGAPPAATASQRTLSSSRVAVALVPLALAAVYLHIELQAQGRPGFPMDDPYIHFQFARNLASGGGFSFNSGEPTPGATSPLWVLMLAAGRLLGAPIEWLALGLGATFAGISAWLTLDVALALGLGLPFSLLAALALGSAGRFTWASLSGMEICLATALSLALIRVHLSNLHGTRRALWLGVLAGLAAQARPEMLLLGLMVGVLEWRRTRGVPARAPALALYTALFLGLQLPYTLFCLTTSGRPFPNTFYIKSLLPLMGTAPELVDLRRTYFRELFGWMWQDNSLIALLLLPGMALWLFRKAARNSVVILVWPVAFWLYQLIAFPRHYNVSRYTIPLMPLVAILAMAPLEWLLARLRSANARALLPAVTWVLLAIPALHGQLAYEQLYAANVDNILKVQVTMADWVTGHVPPERKVALNDVGAITYYGGRYCVDLAGLVSSDVSKRLVEAARRGGRPAIDAAMRAYLLEKRPQYLILFPEWYPQLVQEPWLRKRYEIDCESSTGGGNSMVAYEADYSKAR